MWNWEKTKVLASQRAFDKEKETAVYQCSFSTSDSSTVCISGDGLFRIFRFTDSLFKQITGSVSAKRDPQNYKCHEWLSDERLVIGTSGGEILVMDNNDFKLSLSADNLSVETICGYSRVMNTV